MKSSPLGPRRELEEEIDAAHMAADRSLSLSSFVPDRSVDFLVEGRAAGGELTELVVL